MEELFDWWKGLSVVLLLVLVVGEAVLSFWVVACILGQLRGSRLFPQLDQIEQHPIDHRVTTEENFVPCRSLVVDSECWLFHPRMMFMWFCQGL